eukprot:scaffold65809_cov19-Tisochrysis_lutea.AAC.2
MSIALPATPGICTWQLHARCFKSLLAYLHSQECSFGHLSSSDAQALRAVLLLLPSGDLINQKRRAPSAKAFDFFLETSFLEVHAWSVKKTSLAAPVPEAVIALCLRNPSQILQSCSSTRSSALQSREHACFMRP